MDDILVMDPEGMRPFGTHRYEGENSIEMNLREMV
jgi:hypothetical protein